MSPHLIHYVFAAVVVLTVISILLRSFGQGGYRLAQTVGEVAETSPGYGAKVSVQVMENTSKDVRVRMQVRVSYLTGFRMLPVTLSPDNARDLAGLLKLAAGPGE